MDYFSELLVLVCYQRRGKELPDTHCGDLVPLWVSIDFTCNTNSWIARLNVGQLEMFLLQMNTHIMKCQ